MLSEGDYVIAWTVYLLGSVVLLALFWRLSRRWSSLVLRGGLRLMLAVLLLVPARADLEQAYLAPALVVSILEFAMISDPAAGVVALRIIAYSLLTVLLLFAVALIVRRRFQRGG